MIFISVSSRLLFLLTIIHADPGPPLINQNENIPPVSYNYYGYQPRQSPVQPQTPSPYLYKRNPNGNTYSNPPPSPYGTVSTARPASNQCKLHINCPSKIESVLSIVRHHSYLLGARNRVTLDIQGPPGLSIFTKDDGNMPISSYLFRPSRSTWETRNARP